MSSTDGINNPKQPDPTSPDYWTTPGLDENGIDPIDSADTSDPIQQASQSSTVNKDQLLREKAAYEGRLERMSQGNPARADIEKHIQDLDAQLATADTSSDWDPNSPDDSEETDPNDVSAVNSKYADDTAPKSVDAKTKTATYEGFDEELVFHSNPGGNLKTGNNKGVNNYNITSSGKVTINLESPNDRAKVEVLNGKYVIRITGAKGEETYSVTADKVKSISIQGGGDNSVDTTTLKPEELGKITIGDKAPKWTSDMLKNLPTFIPPAGDGGGDHNLQGATTLVNEIITATKKGDWKGVIDFLKTDPKMLQPNEANDIVRKVLSSLCEPVISAHVKKAEYIIQDYVDGSKGGRGINPQDQIGCFGAGSGGARLGGDDYGHFEDKALGLHWNRYYNWQVHVRESVGNNLQVAERSAVELVYNKLPEDVKNQLIESVKVLPPEVRQFMLAGLTSENGECWMGDRLDTEGWRNVINASLAS